MQMFGSVSKTLDQSMGRRPVKDALWNAVVNIYGKLSIGRTSENVDKHGVIVSQAFS